MSSGFPEDPVEAVDAAAIADPDHDYAVGDEISLVDPDSGRIGAVGYGQEYNNLNFAVLGELIEQVTGGTYAEAVRRHWAARAIRSTGRWNVTCAIPSCSTSARGRTKFAGC